MILTLARGHYCPKEYQQHLELAALYPKIGVAYTQIATISTDNHHTPRSSARRWARWTFLSDPERTLLKEPDIAEYVDPEHNPMVPHIFLLKPGPIIHCIYNGYWFWGRPLRRRPLARNADRDERDPPLLASMDGTSIQSSLVRCDDPNGPWRLPKTRKR